MEGSVSCNAQCEIPESCAEVIIDCFKGHECLPMVEHLIFEAWINVLPMVEDGIYENSWIVDVIVNVSSRERECSWYWTASSMWHKIVVKTYP